MAQRKFVHTDSMWVFGGAGSGAAQAVSGALLPISATAIGVAEDCYIDQSNDYIEPMANATEDEDFLGLALGASLVNEALPLAIARVCIVETTVTSAVLNIGAALKWASKWTYVADGNANTIAWCGGQYVSAATLILAEINVITLGMVSADAKLYETPVA